MNRTLVQKLLEWLRGHPFLIIFIIIFALGITDIVNDFNEGLPISHMAHEFGLLSLVSCLIYYQFKLIKKKRININQLSQAVDGLRARNEELEQEIKKFRGDFQRVIDKQIEYWQLSGGEKDIAKLMLKGLSMKEIASLRTTSEATVRQQASSIYRKANVKDRLELIAFFLEDL